MDEFRGSKFDNDYLYKNFAMYYGSLAERVRDYDETDIGELTLYLENGRTIIYDDIHRSIRELPLDSDRLTPDECRNEFSLRLRSLLDRRCISQKQLAEMAGITEATLSGYITGRATPNFYTLDKIAKVLNCSVDKFRYTN